MQIGPAVLLTDDPQVATLSILVSILSRGGVKNRERWLALAPKLNTKQWPMPLPNSFGLNHYFKSYVFDGELSKDMNTRVPSEPRYNLRKRNPPQGQKNTLLLLPHEFEKLTIH